MTHPNVDVTWEKFGEKTEEGDVIGCLYDLKKHRISFTRNGKLLGTTPTKIDKNMEFYPVVGIWGHDYDPEVFVKLSAIDEFDAGPNVGEDPKQFIYQTNFKYGNYE